MLHLIVKFSKHFTYQMNNYVIIGAAGGIGSQLAADLQSKGSNLLLGYHKSLLKTPHEESLQSAPVDATSFDETLEFISSAKDKFGEIHGIVSLPGSINLKPPHLFTDEEFDTVIAKNLKSAFSVIRAVGRVLKNTSIVLMSTAATRIGLTNHEAVVAGKAGVEAMVRSASVTYARKALRFNAVAPGLVDTPLSSSIVNNPNSLEYSKGLHISGRIGKPKDISNMIQFLINPENSWITGQTFTVDGGLSSVKK